MSKLHVMYALAWFTHYIKESNVENINDSNQGQAWLKCIFFLVLYSRVVMETDQRAKLRGYSLYASSTVLAFRYLNAKQLVFHISILFKWRLFLHIFKC